jgi:hypothetical protein
MSRAMALVLGLVLAVSLGASYENLVDINGRLIVSQNLTNGHRTFLKFGFNDDVDGTEESVSEVTDATGAGNGPDRCILDTTVVGVLSASSSDANDAGLEITVQGVDSNWDDLTIVMNLGVAAATSGTVYTAVGAPTQWLRVNRAFVSDSTATQGVVYLHNDIGDTGNNGIPDIPSTQTRAVINAAEQQTLHACYTIPDDYTAGLFVTEVCASSNSTGGANAGTFRLRQTTEAGADRTQLRFGVGAGLTSCQTFDPPKNYPPRTALEITAEGGAGSNIDASGTISGYLIR